MSDAHIVQLPKAVFILKIAQIALSIIILGLSAYVVYEDSVAEITTVIGAGNSFALFTCIWTLGITAYYILATTALKAAYNWIAIVILECLAVVWWLCAWSTMAAYFVIWRAAICYYDGCDSLDAAAREDAAFGAYVGGWEASIVLSVLQFVLFCTTLGFLAVGIHRHRQAGKPISASAPNFSNHLTGDGRYAGAWTNGSKTESHSMPEIYPAEVPSYGRGQPKVVPVQVQQVPDGYYQPMPESMRGGGYGGRY